MLRLSLIAVENLLAEFLFLVVSQSESEAWLKKECPCCRVVADIATSAEDIIYHIVAVAMHNTNRNLPNN